MPLTLEDFKKLPKFRLAADKIIPLIDDWAMAYGVSRDAIERQLAWAHGWILSNPRKAPKSDIVRFLFNWMRKAKEYGNLVAEKPKPASVAAEYVGDMTYEEMVAIRKANMGDRSRPKEDRTHVDSSAEEKLCADPAGVGAAPEGSRGDSTAA